MHLVIDRNKLGMLPKVQYSSLN